MAVEWTGKWSHSTGSLGFFLLITNVCFLCQILIINLSPSESTCSASPTVFSHSIPAFFLSNMEVGGGGFFVHPSIHTGTPECSMVAARAPWDHQGQSFCSPWVSYCSAKCFWHINSLSGLCWSQAATQGKEENPSFTILPVMIGDYLTDRLLV